MSRHTTAEISDREGQSPLSLKSRDNRCGTNVIDLARERLASSSYPSLRTLRCYFHEGVLTLRGCVPNYHLRQVAWKLVGELPGVEEFVDRVEVIDRPRQARDL